MDNIMEGKIFYVTKEKLQKLQKEHEELVTFERAKTVGQEAPRMLESEDMNPEFISYHEDMDSLRMRIEELKNILDNHEIIKKPSKEQQKFVAIGATVKIGIKGKEDEFTVMGTLEADPVLGRISNESPVGKALLGRKVGDEIIVSSPTKAVYKIKDIKYEIS
jgi:transcription elongation factor GreA